MRPSEQELLRALDVHDQLVARCARGELSYSEFDRIYDGFFVSYPLDGHDAPAEERELLDRFSSRIVLHQKIWAQVLTRVTGVDMLSAAAVAAGFIDADEAARRIRTLAQQHLKI